MSMIRQDVKHVEEWNIVPKKPEPRPAEYPTIELGYIDLSLGNLLLHQARLNVPPVLDKEIFVFDGRYSYDHLLVPNDWDDQAAQATPTEP